MSSIFLVRAMDLPSTQMDNVESKWKDYINLIDSKFAINKEIYSSKFLPSSGGEWAGERGESIWKPNPDGIPKKDNPNNKTWEEILEKKGIDGIEYQDGYPDFLPVSETDIEIDDFSVDRQKNFVQADEKLAARWSKESKDGKTNWAAQDIRQYRQENGLTWHEHQNCRTMQLVPKEIHNNIPHEGGICLQKQKTIVE